MKLFSLWVVGVVLGVGLMGCGSGNDGQVIANQASFVSTTLSSRRATCGTTSSRCTPQNIGGDLCYAILGLGELGASGFYAMTWLAPEATFPDGPSSGSCSTQTFSLAAPTTLTGKVKVPTSEADMPAKQQIVRTELNYNYLDVTFTLAGTAVNDTYTIRTVYTTTYTATGLTGEMKKGDKLMKSNSDTTFKWCNSTTCSATRADVATGIFQDVTVTEATHPGQGNADYVTVTANFPTALAVTYAELIDTTKVWKLDFQVTDAIVWTTKNPSQFTTTRDVIENFRLKFGPNQSSTKGETDDGIRGSLALTASS